MSRRPFINRLLPVLYGSLVNVGVLVIFVFAESKQSCVGCSMNLRGFFESP